MVTLFNIVSIQGYTPKTNMPGKYDPDRLKSENPIKINRKSPPIKRFLTDEEWWESEHYKMARDKTKHIQRNIKEKGI